MNVQQPGAYRAYSDFNVGRQDLVDAFICRGEPGSADPAAHTATADETENDQEKALLCLICSAPITTAAQRIEKRGKHLHTFFNPAGIVYEIGCFQEAPGCLVYGPGSTEFAWFAGHSWRIVYCSECLEHLGWIFSGAEGSFFGLIVNRLREG